MKKLFLIAVIATALFTTSNLNAQFKAGGGLAYGTGINSIGISVDAGYSFTENWEGKADFTYFFKNNLVKYSALDFDANYVFDSGLYPIAGINFTIIGYDFPKYESEYATFGGVSTSSTSFGFNLGLGYNLSLGEALVLSPEIRYTVGVNYLRAAVKLMYLF